MRVSNVRSVEVVLPNGRRTYTVVDDLGLPIPEVDVFLNTFLHASASSLNTIRSYSSHIALFFRWLDIRSAHWENIDFDAFCMFAGDLRDGTLPSLRRAGVYRPQKERTRTTCETILAGVHSFLEYWQLENRGPADLRLYRPSSSRKGKKYGFLAHIEQTLTNQHRLKMRGPKSAPFKIIDFDEDFAKLLSEAHTARDKLLLSALYDGGLRVSQAVGLHHEDILIAEKQIRVRRRVDNANGALSKQRSDFVVDILPRFFRFYAASLVDEQLAMGIDSDYVFVNLRHADRGRPMSAGNARSVIKSIGGRAGVPLIPHMLRHTHGTALAKAGWSAPQIAKRLGQSVAGSADPYIHLADDDITTLYAASRFAEESS
ncbi:tyrosine-type recombinase/integrase [Microbacterium paludicola]|uniref:tyrosine-type recombinase/integrase n=1 Tax=Microbacterium paludicola TaxID=300019 RepID=UPI0011A146F2|nr:tyrosine-type recombinase/integrase [Microbacterium paludicola]